MASLSENNVNVTYDGLSPWAVAGHNNAPYVALSFDPVMAGGTLANTRVITLTGSVSSDIVGNLENVKNNIISVFSGNGKIFEFQDSYGTKKTYNDVFVDSVSFPQANYVGKLNYSITLRLYDWLGGDEVLDPQDQVDAAAQPNGSISLTRVISARGAGWTGKSAGSVTTGVDYAKAWVDSRVALAQPLTILGFATSLNYIILEDSESYNRLTGVYSRTLKYLCDEGLQLGLGAPRRGDNAGGAGAEEFTFTRFHTIVSEGITEESTKVSITAEITGGSNTTTNHFRGGGTVNANWTESFLKAGAQTATGITLCGPPNNLNIDEDLNAKKVTIKADFDTNACLCTNDYYFDHEISANTSYITGVTKLDVSGEIKTKGSRAQKNDIIDTFVTGVNVQLFLSGIAVPAYGLISNVGHPGAALNPAPESLQISRSRSKGTLRLTASFNDEDYLQNYSQADWQINVKSSIPYAKTAPSATENGHWSIQYFNFTTREKVSVSANVTAREDPGIPPAATRASAIGLMNAALGSYAPVGGVWYTVSENLTAKEDSANSSSVSKEISYPAGVPWISLGVGPPPF
jgi:hypothetical protein